MGKVKFKKTEDSELKKLKTQSPPKEEDLLKDSQIPNVYNLFAFNEFKKKGEEQNKTLFWVEVNDLYELMLKTEVKNLTVFFKQFGEEVGALLKDYPGIAFHVVIGRFFIYFDKEDDSLGFAREFRKNIGKMNVSGISFKVELSKNDKDILTATVSPQFSKEPETASL